MRKQKFPWESVHTAAEIYNMTNEEFVAAVEQRCKSKLDLVYLATLRIATRPRRDSLSAADDFRVLTAISRAERRCREAK